MDITLAGSAVTYTPNDDELARVSLEFAAFDGEIGFGSLPVPDSAAALTVASGRAARVNEIATRLTDGFILDQDRSRGPEKAASARVYGFGVQDANALLGGFRVQRTRTAETDVARVLAFAALDGPTWDTTWVLNASTVTLPAKTYDADGGWGELITDLVEFTGKTLFLHDKALGGRCLHYHVLTSGHTSGLTISDVPSAVDGITVYAPQQPVRQRTSVDLANNIKGRDQAGRTSTVTDATSIAAHDADGLQHQALIDFEATSQADLAIKTAAFLASQKDERDTHTLAIGPLDATALALIRVGDLIPVTSTILGLTASVQRIAHMTLTVYGDIPAPGLWLASLELGAPVRRRARVKPSLTGVIVPSQAPWSNDPTIGTCRALRETFTRTVAAGSLGVSEFTGSAWSPLFSTAYQAVNGDEAVLNPLDASAVAATTTGAAIGLPLLYPIHIRSKFRIMGPDPGSLLFTLAQGPYGSFPAGTGNLVIDIGYNIVGQTSPLRMTATQTSGAGGTAGAGVYPIGGTDPAGSYLWVEFILTTIGFDIRCWLDSTSAPAYTSYLMGGAHVMIGTPNTMTVVAGTQVVPIGEQPEWRVTLIEVLCDTSPLTGQRIIGEFVMVGDGVRSTATLQYPYMPGSVTIEVDGTDQEVTETNPVTGAITLTFTPIAGEYVYADYQRGV